MWGTKESRPAWNEVWERLQKGKIKTLVVHALDRLGRSLPHLVKILTTCIERNVTLISFRENIDLSTSSGRMLAGIFSVLAEYELSIIRERTKAGLRAAKARGKQIGKKRNYFNKQKATELRDQGWGQIKIARELKIGVGRINKWIHEEIMKIRRRPRKRYGVSIYLAGTLSAFPEGRILILRLERLFSGTILAEGSRIAAAKCCVGKFGQYHPHQQRISSYEGSGFNPQAPRFTSRISPYALAKRLTPTPLFGNQYGYMLDNYTDVWLINVVELNFPF